MRSRPIRFLTAATLVAAVTLFGSGCSKDKGSSGAPGTPMPVAESFNTGSFTAGVFVHTFNTLGTFRYHCSIHGSQTSGMNGDVTVIAGTPDSAKVNISSLTFSPNAVTIHQGGYVKWVANGVNHTVTRP